MLGNVMLHSISHCLLCHPPACHNYSLFHQIVAKTRDPQFILLFKIATRILFNLNKLNKIWRMHLFTLNVTETLTWGYFDTMQIHEIFCCSNPCKFSLFNVECPYSLLLCHVILLIRLESVQLEFSLYYTTKKICSEKYYRKSMHQSTTYLRA